MTATIALTDEIQIVDPCSSEDWTQFVNEHRDATIFHHPAWMRLIRDTYGYPMFCVCVVRCGRLIAGIPFADVHSAITGNRWVSLPFSDHCPPLIPQNEPQILQKVICFLKSRIGCETQRIEIHAPIMLSDQLFSLRPFIHHTLNVSQDEETLFRAFDKRTTQRSIRISEKKGVKIAECNSFDEFEAFYDLHLKTRRRLGVPIQPRSLFTGMWKHILEQGLGFSLVAFRDVTPLAGGVFFKFNKTLSFKYSASNMAFKSLHGSHAVVRAAIQRAHDEGCTTFDFGRSEICNLGLRRFKNNWGATESDLSYTVISNVPPFHRSPVLDQILGQVIRHSPTFVCKLTGKVLYRHFA